MLLRFEEELDPPLVLVDFRDCPRCEVEVVGEARFRGEALFDHLARRAVFHARDEEHFLRREVVAQFGKHEP